MKVVDVVYLSGVVDHYIDVVDRDEHNVTFVLDEFVDVHCDSFLEMEIFPRHFIKR